MKLKRESRRLENKVSYSEELEFSFREIPGIYNTLSSGVENTPSSRVFPESEGPKWEFHQETELLIRGWTRWHPLWPQFLDKAATGRFLYVYHGPAFLGMLSEISQEDMRATYQAMTGSGYLYLWRRGGIQGGHSCSILDYFMEDEEVMRKC